MSRKPDLEFGPESLHGSKVVAEPVVGGKNHKSWLWGTALTAVLAAGGYYALTKVFSGAQEKEDYTPKSLLDAAAIKTFKREAPAKIYEFILNIPNQANQYPYTKIENIDFAGTKLRVVESQPLVERNLSNKQDEQKGWQGFYNQLDALRILPENCYFVNLFYVDPHGEESRMTSYDVCRHKDKTYIFSVDGYNKFSQLSYDAFVKHFTTNFTFTSRTSALTVLKPTPSP